MFQIFSIFCVDIDAFEDKTKIRRFARFQKMNKHLFVDNDLSWFSCVVIIKEQKLKCWLIMNSMFNKCFSNYEIYFVCSIEKTESCQKYCFNETKIAISWNIVKQSENLVIDK